MYTVTDNIRRLWKKIKRCDFTKHKLPTTGATQRQKLQNRRKACRLQLQCTLSYMESISVTAYKTRICIRML